MTSPNGGVPSGGITGSGGMAAHAGTTEGQWRQSIYDQVNSSFGNVSIFGALLQAFTAGFANVIDAIFGTVDDNYIRDMPIVMDHSQSIQELREAYDQLVLQGMAIVFESNNTYYPSEGVTSLDVILLGAGAGGAAGRWDLVPGNRRGGGGGGGGGEVHTTIPASLLPRTGDAYDGIAIVIGAGGAGGTGSEGAGSGGGNTMFGEWLLAGGGVGGIGTGSATGGLGGSGMIPGGSGGRGANASGNGLRANDGGNSTSSYDLHGGGGGGGGGGVDFVASGLLSPGTGGVGGISPGGYGGLSTRDGTPPSRVIATGGGGGGGSSSSSRNGGAGAYPSGGGGGGFGGAEYSNGGAGGAARLYVIERRS